MFSSRNLKIIAGWLTIYSIVIESVTEDPNVLFVPADIAEDATLTTAALIFKYGFPVEIHNVTTHDGYILQLERIPRPGNQPVFLQHGLLDSSGAFVIMGPEKGLAYILAQQGYDVWLGNSRGNRYSRNHVNMSPRNQTFWKFTWHEMGIYDLPASIDYIIRRTQFYKIHYIGHSQGTTAFFVMCSERPEYNSKILLMQALAPVAYMTNSRTPLRNLLLNLLDTVTLTSSAFRIYELLPNTKLISGLAQRACLEKTRMQRYCSNLLFLFGGYNEGQMNMTMLPVIYGHIPAGASIMQLIHYGQVMKSQRFQHYDYGPMSNFLRYGSLRPKTYDLARVTSPIVLHYASNDYLSAAEDVDNLAKQLPSLISKRLVPMEKFNHMDFIWGIDAKQLLYENIINNLKRFSIVR